MTAKTVCFMVHVQEPICFSDFRSPEPRTLIHVSPWSGEAHGSGELCFWMRRKCPQSGR